ncbi:MAG TPA: hypothetical protein VJ783_13225 [Pirellulales bacterium]|nr:hypothetical protein [Pirellulales bacterium]
MSVNVPRSRLRRLLKRAAQTIAALVALAVVARFAYLVSCMDGGWRTVLAQWQPGWSGGDEWPDRAVPRLEPPQQATFWLKHIDEIADGPGDPAQLAMGGAWILDHPSPHYMSKHLEARFGSGRPFSAEDTGQAVNEFHRLCGAKCLALAKRATDLEPTNVNWWRMRAMLTSSINLGSHVSWESMRTDQWTEILEEAAPHDPDNALYDYLAAARLWKANGKYEPRSFAPRSDGIEWTLTVHDAHQFAKGTEYFERGQTKKFVAFGEAGLPAIFEFIKRSGLPRDVQAELATSSLYLLRSSDSIVALGRWQMARIDERAGAGDRVGALKLARQCSKALSQFEAAGETTAFELVLAVFQQRIAMRLLQLAESEPIPVTTEEKAAVMRDACEAILRVKVWQEAANRAAKPRLAPPDAVDIIEGAVLAFTPKSVVALLIGGLTAGLVAALFARGACRLEMLPAWQHAVIWSIACTLVFAILGIAPAEFVSIDKQPWIAAGALLGVVVLTGGILFWRSNFRFTIRTLFVTVSISALLSAFLAMLHRQAGSEDRLVSLAILPKGVAKLDAAAVESALRMVPQSWTVAAWQWFVHSGFYFSVAAAPLLVTVWSAMRRLGRKEGDHQTSPRVWSAALCRDGARSALALAALLLLADLSLTPKYLLQFESDYQAKTLFLRHPEEGPKASRAAIVAVEGDPAAMTRLRALADEEVDKMLTGNRD